MKFLLYCIRLCHVNKTRLIYFSRATFGNATFLSSFPMIVKTGWLLQLELEAIKRQLEDEFQGQFGEDAATEVETE